MNQNKYCFFANIDGRLEEWTGEFSSFDEAKKFHVKHSDFWKSRGKELILYKTGTEFENGILKKTKIKL